MNERLAKIAVPSAVIGTCLLALYLSIFRPYFLYRIDLLSAVIFLQLVFLALWKFKERFFPLMLLAFMWAGTGLPLAGAWSTGRWAVLAIGAIAW